MVLSNMKKVLLVAVFGLAMVGCSRNSTNSQGGAADQSSANSEDLKQLEDTRVGPNATGLFDSDANAHTPLSEPGASDTNASSRTAVTHSQSTNAAKTAVHAETPQKAGNTQ